MFAQRIDRHLVSVTKPTSMEAEQYQTLRLKIERFQRERDLKVVAITSPGARDGKSVTAINLAAALARGTNARVLLIEADVRRPAMSRYLGLNGAASQKSLAQLIANDGGTLQDGVQQFDSLRFDLMLAGTPDMPVNELLRSPRVATILNEAREQYDYVVVDTPPLGPVSDCALLARWVDGLLLVVAAHKTPRKMLESSLNQLDGGSVLGIVFNGDDRPLFGYRHSYYRGYFPSGPAQAGRHG
jgi:capsular exopolysaccharide synthesis family protein